jgi:hypothetical protein
LKIAKESSEEEFEDTKGVIRRRVWRYKRSNQRRYLQTLLIALLVSSNSSSDYSFGIFKLLLWLLLWYLQTPLLITPLVSSNFSSDYSLEEELEDTKGVIRRGVWRYQRGNQKRSLKIPKE